MSAPERINKLKAAMHGMAGAAEAPSPTILTMPAAVTAEAAERPTLSPSRRGKRNVSVYVNPTAAKQLRLLMVEQDTTVQALMEEAMNDLFRKYGKSAIV